MWDISISRFKKVIPWGEQRPQKLKKLIVWSKTGWNISLDEMLCRTSAPCKLKGSVCKGRRTDVCHKGWHVTADMWRPLLGAAYKEERVTSSGDLSTAQSMRRRGRKLAYNYMHHYSLMYGCFVELQPLSNLITHYSCWSDLLRKRQLSGFSNLAWKMETDTQSLLYTSVFIFLQKIIILFQCELHWHLLVDIRNGCSGWYTDWTGPERAEGTGLQSQLGSKVIHLSTCFLTVWQQIQRRFHLETCVATSLENFSNNINVLRSCDQWWLTHVKGPT